MSAKLKVYLAARYSRREEMCRYRNQLESGGHIEVTSRWINGEHQAENDELVHGGSATRFASEDIKDLDDAVVVVNFTEEPRGTSSRGGRHVEFGYALAMRKHVIVVGPRENVFHCIGTVRVFGNWMAALSSILDLAKAYISSRG